MDTCAACVLRLHLQQAHWNSCVPRAPLILLILCRCLLREPSHLQVGRGVGPADAAKRSFPLVGAWSWPARWYQAVCTHSCKVTASWLSCGARRTSCCRRTRATPCAQLLQAHAHPAGGHLRAPRFNGAATVCCRCNTAAAPAPERIRRCRHACFEQCSRRAHAVPLQPASRLHCCPLAYFHGHCLAVEARHVHVLWGTGNRSSVTQHIAQRLSFMASRRDWARLLVAYDEQLMEGLEPWLGAAAWPHARRNRELTTTVWLCFKQHRGNTRERPPVPRRLTCLRPCPRATCALAALLSS